MPLKNFDQVRFDNFIQRLVDKDFEKAASLEEKGIKLGEIDPFSALFESATLGISLEEWVERNEKSRVRQKSLQNHIGKLHEVAISCFKGWQLSNSTADVESGSAKVIAEIKNKHNTMNSSSALATYRKMEQLMDGKYEGYQGYVVQIIPKSSSKPYCVNYRPSDSSKKKAKLSADRSDIKLIDGQSFYALVNGGDLNTMNLVYEKMGESLLKFIGSSAKVAVNDSLYSELIESIQPSLRDQ